MELGAAYVERVYAGVLGKMVGVYLGRPFEGWSYERIAAELGEIDGYVHDRLGKPLIVPDDDLSGTFGFVRALTDRGCPPDLTPAQIGETWLNEIVEGCTILWWGGMGNATEHTAYLRMKHGITAPASGSIATNGTVIAEQIGAQIFIDGWAMLCPGDPERAADFARRAASVSHDGAAIHGAQIIAVMEAEAFVEADLNELCETALRFIPRDSVITRLWDDVREWHTAAPHDWRATRARVAAKYGYDKYTGACHIVPNHAVIALGLLHGAGDFARTLAIVNQCGWDTDCNSGNAGCLLGIRGGLGIFDAADGKGGGQGGQGRQGSYDWRGPVADRLYVVTAEGGGTVTDAARETYALANAACALVGDAPLVPKDGARFHFTLPGSVQGFIADDPGTTAVANAITDAATGTRSLTITTTGHTPARPAIITTPTFISPDALDTPGYGLAACPTLYPGQTIRARMIASPDNVVPVHCRLVLRVYDAGNTITTIAGPVLPLTPGTTHLFEWRVPDTAAGPIMAVGLSIETTDGTRATVQLDRLTWDGTPEVTFTRSSHDGTLWQRAWADGVDQWQGRWPEPFRLIQNRGTGLILQGTRDWTDYTARATVTPHLCEASGIAVRAQGLRRYYALMLHRDGNARLVKVCDGEHVLATAPCAWQFDTAHDFTLTAQGTHLHAVVDGTLHLDADDLDAPLLGGAVAFVITEGCLSADAISVRPV